MNSFDLYKFLERIIVNFGNSFNELIKLVYYGVTVLSFYSKRNTKNDLLFCMLFVASQAVGVTQNCLLYLLTYSMEQSPS